MVVETGVTQITSHFCMCVAQLRKGRDGLAHCQETEISKRTDEKTGQPKKWRLDCSKVLVPVV